MPRPPRQEQAGGFFHVAARANGRDSLFLDDRDRSLFLLTLGEVVGRTGWSCLAYCLMSNHYHLVVRTPEENLAVGMERLNGCYASGFNVRHARRGRVFGARYWAEPVRRDEHLVEALRYVALNPVRAGMVARAEDWRWSSHRVLLDHDAPPGWLDIHAALEPFAGPGRSRRARYGCFVDEGFPPTTRTTGR